MTATLAPPTARNDRLLLASASPRRRDLLRRLGLRFDVAVPDIDERPEIGEPPLNLARRLAREKALAAASGRPHTVVLAADTVVSRVGYLFGKPRDASDAVRLLQALRGERHEVVTAVCILAPGDFPRVAAVGTAVWMRHYTDDEITAYVATGAGFDKAGGYGIQDEDFRPVARIEGCYTNVVGLPLCLTSRLLRAAGIRVRASEAACQHQSPPSLRLAR